jgi:hypothetical protein
MEAEAQSRGQVEGQLLHSNPVAQAPRRASVNQAAMAERGVPPQRNPEIPPQQVQAPLQQPQTPYPPQQQRQAPPQPEQQDPAAQEFFAPKSPEPQFIPPGKRAKHPVIQKLLKRFGLKKAERYKLEIYSEDQQTEYLMTVLPDELNAWALAEGKKKAIALDDVTIGVYFEHLVVCTAVIAIDSVPVWRLFDIKPESWEAEDLIEDTLNIPLRMRKMCGLQLAELLWSETMSLTDKLSDFYQNKILDKHKLKSSFDAENEGTYRYVCVRDECATVEIMQPETRPDGTEQNFYCKYCAGPLVKAADMSVEKSVPLG